MAVSEDDVGARVVKVCTTGIVRVETRPVNDDIRRALGRVAIDFEISKVERPFPVRFLRDAVEANDADVDGMRRVEPPSRNVKGDRADAESTPIGEQRCRNRVTARPTLRVYCYAAIGAAPRYGRVRGCWAQRSLRRDQSGKTGNSQSRTEPTPTPPKNNASSSSFPDSFPFATFFVAASASQSTTQV